MKKFISCILSMAIMAGAAVSCGKTEDSKDDKKAGTSASDTANEDKKTDNSENPAIGRWKAGEYSIFDIVSENEAYYCMKQDMSQMMYLDEDDHLYVGGEDCGTDSYDFDGENFVLHAMSDNDLTMKKTDDSSDIFGEYEMISGSAYDIVAKGYNKRAEENDDDKSFGESGTRLFIICNVNSTMLEARMEISGFKIEDGKMTAGADFLGTDESVEVEYEVDGDTLVWKYKSGKVNTFTRADE